MGLQNSKTKLFDTNGIILEQRWTDSQEVVSYVIRTDAGLITTRHRKFLKELHPTNDPTNYDNLTHLKAADHDILNVETEQNATIDDTATEQAEKIGKRRSGRIKRHTSLKGISTLGVNKVRILQAKSGAKMGATCSTKLKKAQEEIKILKQELSRHENGGSDQSIRASQTKIDLFNLASEENEECGCANGSSGGGRVTIIEVIA